VQTFTDETTATPRSGVRLWAVMLGPPLLWLTQFEIIYALAPKLSGSARVATVVVALIALFAIAGCGLASMQYYRLADASPMDVFAHKSPRVRFMAALGSMLSVLFFLLTAVQLTATLFIPPGPQ
jgi:hypothetical protein